MDDNSFESSQQLSNCFVYIDMVFLVLHTHETTHCEYQDCFYVSVERRDNPSLDGKKVIVCPTSNLSPKSLENSTSEVSSCSYEARECGVKSRMFLKDAYHLCPDAVFLPCNYKRYEQTSEIFYSVLRKYSTSVRPISADEALLGMLHPFFILKLSNILDVSNCGKDIDSDLDSHVAELEGFIQEIRDDVLNATGCPCSAGVGTNMLLAKLAVSDAKPNGQKVVRTAEVPQFLNQIPVQRLPRVGEVLTAKLHQMEVHCVSDLLKFSQVRQLVNEFFLLRQSLHVETTPR